MTALYIAIYFFTGVSVSAMIYGTYFLSTGQPVSDRRAETVINIVMGSITIALLLVIAGFAARHA